MKTVYAAHLDRLARVLVVISMALTASGLSVVAPLGALVNAAEDAVEAQALGLQEDVLVTSSIASAIIGTQAASDAAAVVTAFPDNADPLSALAASERISDWAPKRASPDVLADTPSTSSATIVETSAQQASLTNASPPQMSDSAKLAPGSGNSDGTGGFLTPVNLQSFSCSDADLVIPNGQTCILPAGTYNYNSILVQSGGTLVLTGNMTSGAGVTLTVANTMTVASGGVVSANGMGYTGTIDDGNGPGGGRSSDGQAGGGAGHGGYGGQGYFGGGAGSAYGSVTQPTALGSSGAGNYASLSGANGGGALHLITNGALKIDGSVTANGNQTGSVKTGGGSGGSIWITVSSLEGNGSITANGGSSTVWTGAGGAGGRIAIEFSNSTFPFDADHLQAYGSWGTLDVSGAGTIYLKQIGSDPRGQLLVDNANQQNGTYTVLSALAVGQNYNFSKVTISRSGRLLASAPYSTSVLTADELLISTGAYTSELALVPYDDGDTDYTDDAPFVLNAITATIQSGGWINANGQGYAGTTANGLGPGGGINSGCCSSGGGYGGRGGDGATDCCSPTPEGGPSYGSISHPTDLGSAGASRAGSKYTGAYGGGAIQLVVTGTLTLNSGGLISANGSHGVANDGSNGGGSGGGIWITAKSVLRSGAMQAKGGDGGGCGFWCDAGGGGGGRVAIHADSISAGITFQVAGGLKWMGTGAENGYPGTVYLRGNLVDLPRSQAFATNECPFCNNRNRVFVTGLGINVYSGNFNYQHGDGQVAAKGFNLSFERSYNSLVTGANAADPTFGIQTVYSGTLGFGCRTTITCACSSTPRVSRLIRSSWSLRAARSCASRTTATARTRPTRLCWQD